MVVGSYNPLNDKYNTEFITTSSYVTAIGYRPIKKEMRVILNNDYEIIYKGVPKFIVHDFKTAESVGKYYHMFVKGMFDIVKERKIPVERMI